MIVNKSNVSTGFSTAVSAAIPKEYNQVGILYHHNILLGFYWWCLPGHPHTNRGTRPRTHILVAEMSRWLCDRLKSIVGT